MLLILSKMKTAIVLFLSLIVQFTYAQISTGINNENPNPKAALDIKGSFSTPQGFLMPRYSSDQSTSFALTGNNSVGVTYYDTTAGIFRYYLGGGAWSSYGGTTGWSLTGNALTPADTIGLGTKFVGTTTSTPLIFMTNGTQRMRISRTGNIGIGMNPSSGIPLSLKSNGTGQVLQIENSSSLSSLFEFRETSNNYARMMLNNGGTTAIQLSAGPDFPTFFKGTYFGINTTSPSARFNVNGWSRFDTLAGTGDGMVMVNSLGDLYRVASTGGWSILGNAGTNNTNFVGTSDNADLRFRTNNITRMVIDSASGNIGIGTTIPTTPVDILKEGSIAILMATSHSGTNNASGTSVIMRRSAGTSTIGATLVGINDVLGQIVAQGFTSGTTYANAASIILAVDSIPSTTSMPGRIQFNTTPAGTLTPVERMRIANNGNVGIGIAAPLTQLQIQGNNIITSATQYGNIHVGTSNVQSTDVGGSITLGGSDENVATTSKVFGSIEGRKTTSTNAQSSGYLIFKTNTLGTLSERMRIANNGNIGIGTSTTANKKVSIEVPATNTTEGDALSINSAYSGISNKRGLYINLTADGIGTHYGIYNDVDGLAGDPSPLYGSFNSFTPNGTGTAFGNFTTISAVGTGARYGANYAIASSSTNTSNIYGSYASINAGGSGAHYANYATFSGTGTGTKYGLYVSGEDYNYFSGFVGIGILVPKAPLQVKGDVALGDGTVANGANRAIVVFLENVSTTARVAGDIVIASGSNSFITTNTASNTSAIGVLMENCAINQICQVAVAGVATVRSTAGLIGQHCITSTVIGVAGTDPTPISGASIGVYLTNSSGTTCQVLLK